MIAIITNVDMWPTYNTFSSLCLNCTCRVIDMARLRQEQPMMVMAEARSPMWSWIWFKNLDVASLSYSQEKEYPNKLQHQIIGTYNSRSHSCRYGINHWLFHLWEHYIMLLCNSLPTNVLYCLIFVPLFVVFGRRFYFPSSLKVFGLPEKITFGAWRCVTQISLS